MHVGTVHEHRQATRDSQSPSKRQHKADFPGNAPPPVSLSLLAIGDGMIPWEHSPILARTRGQWSRQLRHARHV